ncbi:MAG TPA: hypothetical protein VH414_13075 [Lichenihabitans sp.]|jgi:hypothetical protein|nr:hypothetical protein [Lichenihabitans sp.]
MVEGAGRSRDRGRRGAALLIVLVFCALLSSLAAVVLRGSLSGARSAAAFEKLTQADELGLSVGDLVLSYVSTGPAERRRGGRFDVRLPGVEIEVAYVSESARIDANAAPPELIAALLRTAGAEPAEVAAALDRIAALRTPAAPPTGPGAAPAAAADAGTASPLGRDASVTPVATATAPPVLPNQPAAGAQANAAPPIQSVAEVARAWGLSDALAARVAPALTVASRAAKVDPILAARAVVLALFGGDAERTDDFLQRRAQGFATRDSELLLVPVETRSFVGFDDAMALRVVARVTLAGDFSRRYEVVLGPVQGRGQDLKVLSWQKIG